MNDSEPDHVERGTLLALFVLSIIASGLIVACLGWGTAVVAP